MKYQQWEKNRRYSVIRSHRGLEPDAWEKVEVSDLTFEEATEKAIELTEIERKLHPEQTSWTRDLFWRSMDTPKWFYDRNPQPQQLGLFDETRTRGNALGEVQGVQDSADSRRLPVLADDNGHR